MLERQHLVLGGCVGKGTQDSDHIVMLTQNGESLKEEGALAVIICALCCAPYYYYYYYYYYYCYC